MGKKKNKTTQRGDAGREKGYITISMRARKLLSGSSESIRLWMKRRDTDMGRLVITDH